MLGAKRCWSRMLLSSAHCQYSQPQPIMLVSRIARPTPAFMRFRLEIYIPEITTGARFDRCLKMAMPTLLHPVRLRATALIVFFPAFSYSWIPLLIASSSAMGASNGKSAEEVLSKGLEDSRRVCANHLYRNNVSPQRYVLHTLAARCFCNWPRRSLYRPRAWCKATPLITPTQLWPSLVGRRSHLDLQLHKIHQNDIPFDIRFMIPPILLLFSLCLSFREVRMGSIALSKETFRSGGS